MPFFAGFQRIDRILNPFGHKIIHFSCADVTVYALDGESVSALMRSGRIRNSEIRRHDNCDCTVTFENGSKRTFSCGKLRSFALQNVRQDVWSKREWEVPFEDARAGEPVVLTEEQAEKLQAEHGLTKLDESGKINKKLSDRMTNENVNSKGYGIFEFSDIEKEMSSSSIGRHTLAYIESDGLSIVMDYSPYQPDDTDGYIIGTTIYINAAIHVDETHVAETIIHECAHRQFS